MSSLRQGSRTSAVLPNGYGLRGDPTIADIAILGVRRPWRRRGPGRAPLRDAFGRCRARGLVAAKLGVDLDGEPRALDLHQKEGMRVVRRADAWARILRSGQAVRTEEER
jgi:GNAT superfamily N-acetyltransferase